MPGTLFGLGLSQQIGIDRKPLAGCKLHLYAANTSTPVDAFREIALVNKHPWPIEADSTGRIPAFWLADGSYRARLTTYAGVAVFDEASITAIGASSGGGGFVDSTPAEAIFSTGDFKWRPVSGTLTGWVRANARTIGSATSGATERANADCQSLFEFLWNNFSDTLCPVSGGRGGSAAADWAANKAIATPDLRGRSPFGLDDMGNASASRLTGGTFAVGDGTTAGSHGGAATHTLSETQLPAHTHTGTTDADGAHQHDIDFTPYAAPAGGIATVSSYPGASTAKTNSGTNDGAHQHAFTTNATGSGAAHNIMPPFYLGTWFVKL